MLSRGNGVVELVQVLLIQQIQGLCGTFGLPDKRPVIYFGLLIAVKQFFKGDFLFQERPFDAGSIGCGFIKPSTYAGGIKDLLSV